MRKENILPYQWKGRWYRIHLKSGTKSYKIIKDEIGHVNVSGNNLVLPNGFHLIDRKLDITSVSDGTENEPGRMKVLKSGEQGIQLPTNDSCSEVSIYIFGYQE